MEKLDCLFIYPGAPRGERNLLPIMPAGLTSIAGYLARHSVRSAIVNLPTAGRREFDLPALIRERGVRLVCIPAHWHRQAGAAVALAARLKKNAPGVRTVLGGYTASRFAAEILKDCPTVDFVVRGDGELPMLELVRAVAGGAAALRRVPNLAWRESGRVRLNPLTYSARSAGLGAPVTEGLDLILNKDRRPRRGVLCEDGMFNYLQARGCSESCAACGGGKDFHRKFFGRKGVAIKSPAGQAEDIARLMAAGFGRVQLPLDPLDSDKYRLGLLALLARRKKKPVLKMELCGLPSRALLAAFPRATAPGSGLTVFAGSGSERVRRLNRGRFYTNAGLLGALKEAIRLGVNVWVTFTTGLPFETREDFLETARLIRLMRAELGKNKAGIYAFPLEPGSPMFESPARYGLKPRRRFFRDFLRQGGRYDVGYSTTHFTEREIARNLRCLENLADEPVRPRAGRTRKKRRPL